MAAAGMGVLGAGGSGPGQEPRQGLRARRGSPQAGPLLQASPDGFNMLSRLVITFLIRSKRLLISRLQSPSAVILEPRKIKSAMVSTVSPSISMK